MHRDPDSLEEWSSKSIVKINKGKVLHLGQNNQRAQCQPESVWLGSSPAARDRGVLADSKLNMSQQCTAAATRANQVWGCICRGITSRDSDMIIPLLLSACQATPGVLCPVLVPTTETDMDRLERVQRKAMKTIKGLENLPYGGETGGLRSCLPGGHSGGTS